MPKGAENTLQPILSKTAPRVNVLTTPEGAEHQPIKRSVSDGPRSFYKGQHRSLKGLLLRKMILPFNPSIIVSTNAYGHLAVAVSVSI